jgi:hypothetical protein
MVDFREWFNMSGVGQAVFMNQRSFGPPPPGAIGSAYQGGFYAGDISTTANSVATHYLVIGPLSTAQSQLRWKNEDTATPGADSDIDGPQNTADMVADGNSTVYPCAHFCNNLSLGGFSDWYMPAKNELEVCYFNLKPTTNNNNISSGINPNAVPARASNYTNSPMVPNQTSAAAFQAGGSEAFEDSTGIYWSSTESSFSYESVYFAYRQYFLIGQQAYNPKSRSYKVRAVRRLEV